ncbi:universal stress protein [Pseudomonas sp. 21LCFQ02]|uniref:universal stress protein n=1 Tax=Pseudomonas sp. 21LCFQ02 TaxID=2957505 RepID=UPI00209B0C4E|nr:universal stress protein [Pseudomonas sp. 21LCFQ02]MCO8168350.1 universal stress protein [Pseudomonas sp. 21LCFQ02]
MFTTILVALDGSAQSLKVLELASSLTGPDTTLHLVCVVDPAYALDNPDDAFEQQQYPAAAAEQHHAQDLIEQARQRLGLACVRTTLSGEPAEAICAEARRIGSDLIVIGHRHLSFLARLLDPSVGSKVLDAAPCPVLVEVR